MLAAFMKDRILTELYGRLIVDVNPDRALLLPFQFGQETHQPDALSGS
jgi:hypothetical protein